LFRIWLYCGKLGKARSSLCLRAGPHSAFRDKNFHAVNTQPRHLTISLESHLLRHLGWAVMDAHEVYQYSELTGDDAIHLIHLEPCDDLEASVECFLKDTTLAEYRNDIGDHYIALSYVWGDQTDTRSISVDGRRLEITASLDSALRYIRDHQRVLRIWADGFCLDVDRYQRKYHRKLRFSLCFLRGFVLQVGLTYRI